jgi:hypothetical protein
MAGRLKEISSNFIIWPVLEIEFGVQVLPTWKFLVNILSFSLKREDCM